MWRSKQRELARGKRLGLALTLVALSGCGTTGPSGSPAASGRGATESPAITCASTDLPNPLGVEYLGQPLERGSEKLAVEVLIGEDTGETDLGKVPGVTAFKLTGSAPISDPESRLVAFEATSGADCEIRIVVDVSLLDGGKGEPRLVEWDLNAATHATLPDGGSGFCTWLMTEAPKAAGVECVGMQVTGDLSIPRARAWIRVAWAVPAEGPLPDWARPFR
jgi:hypothetical protein